MHIGAKLTVSIKCFPKQINVYLATVT